jgi:hypothetical protein
MTLVAAAVAFDGASHPVTHPGASSDAGFDLHKPEPRVPNVLGRGGRQPH